MCAIFSGTRNLRRIHNSRNFEIFRVDIWHDNRTSRSKTGISSQFSDVTWRRPTGKKSEWWPTAAGVLGCNPSTRTGVADPWRADRRSRSFAEAKHLGPLGGNYQAWKDHGHHHDPLHWRNETSPSCKLTQFYLIIQKKQPSQANIYYEDSCSRGHAFLQQDKDNWQNTPRTFKMCFAFFPTSKHPRLAIPLIVTISTFIKTIIYAITVICIKIITYLTTDKKFLEHVSMNWIVQLQTTHAGCALQVH